LWNRTDFICSLRETHSEVTCSIDKGIHWEILLKSTKSLHQLHPIWDEKLLVVKSGVFMIQSLCEMWDSQPFCSEIHNNKFNDTQLIVFPRNQTLERWEDRCEFNHWMYYSY
jgi:hypothetical protein